ncbi:MAG: tetratricopeptide repeat protein [Chloroflexota bacterium]
MKRSLDPNISTQTELGHLRDLLDDAERQVVVMHETSTGARDVIRAMDEIDRLLALVARSGVDVRAEEGRAEFLRRRLTRAAPGVVRLVQAADLSSTLSDSPTWQAILAAQAEQSRQRVRRLFMVGGPILAVLLTIIVLTLLFPPPPQANLTAIRRLAQEGQIDEALATAQAEATRVPTDPEAALWIGALQTIKGDTAAAEAAWEEARRLIDDEMSFYFERGSALLEAGRPDDAEPDARRLIEQPTTAPTGYLLLGGIEEARGRVPEAIAAFQQAADLAHAAGNSQLEVIAKTRMGMVMQASGIPLTPTP